MLYPTPLEFSTAFSRLLSARYANAVARLRVGLLPAGLITWLFLLLFWSPPSGAERSLSAAVQRELSNNVRRQSEDTQSDAEDRLQLGLRWFEQQKNTEFLLDYNLQSINYVDNQLDDREQLNGTSELEFRLFSGRMNWRFAHQRSQVEIDPAGEAITNNLQDSDTLTFGPQWIMRLSSVDSLTLGYERARFFADDTQLDNERDSLNIYYRHRFSPLLDLTATLVRSIIDYDIETVETRNWSLGFIYRTPTWEWTTNFGRSEIERSNLDSDTQGDNSEVNLKYMLSSRSTVTWLYSDRVTDQSQRIDIAQLLGAEGFDLGDFTVQDVFQETENSLQFEHQSSAGSRIGLRLYRSELDYETEGRDQREDGYGFLYEFQLTSRSNISFDLDVSRQTLQQDDSDKRRKVAKLSYRLDLSRSLKLKTAVEHTAQNANQATANYDESRFALGLDYRY